MKRDYSALLADKNWGKVQARLMTGIKGEDMKKSLATVLANTRQALIADTVTQNMVYLPKLVLPLVRRLWPKLIANQIISTQPLDGPMGMIRYLDAYLEDLNGNVINGGVGQRGIYPWGVGDTTYSTPQSAVADAVLVDGTANTEVNFNGALSKTPSEGTIFVEVGDTVTHGAGTVYTKVGEVDRGGVIHSLGATQVFGVVDMKSKTYIVNFAVAPVFTVRFSYKEDIQKNIPFGTGKNYNTMKFDITRIPVEAKTRKLGATYSFELMEDYKNEFGENFEDKMVDYLTTTILTEIDGETIGMLFNKATSSGSWDATMPATWTRGINSWYETIMPKINKLSNQIYQATHVAGATFMVMSPVTATIFQSMIQYSGEGDPRSGNLDVGTVKLGTLNNMYTVYTSPLCPDNKILLGFKGKTPEETGAIYAPYVPVQLHPIYYSEGMPSVMARTRYWMGVLRPDYYGIVDIQGTI